MGNTSSMNAFLAPQHPNVMRTLMLRKVPGFYHVVLEHCSGGNLRRRVCDTARAGTRDGGPPSVMLPRRWLMIFFMENL